MPPKQIRTQSVTAIPDTNYKIIATSSAMRQVLEWVYKVAASDAPVLIEGESGTGKELIAREIHEASRLAAGPMVPVNCAVVCGELLASELFGHVRGSFTSAITSKPGLFQAAAGGTLFIDEVSEMSLSSQAKLLRALESYQIRPVGSTELITVDVRIIAATNRDLAAEIAAKRFREDLYYRLKVLPIKMPPLRNRSEEIPALVEYFLGHESNSTVSEASDQAWQ